MIREGIRHWGRTCGTWLRDRSLTLFGTAVVTWWVVPLIWPRGGYAGCYHFLDLEVGLVAGIIWLGWFAVATAPIRWRRPLAVRLIAAGGAGLIVTAVGDVSTVVWTAYGRTFWYYGQAFSSGLHTHDPELIWRLRPGFVFRGRANPFSHHVEFRTDENGFRNPAGTTRAELVFLGDSVTMAAEVPDEATFVRKTAEALGRDAVNLGVFCYGPQQELAVLKRFGLAYRPRAVIWQVTEWNDLEDAERYARRDHPDRPQVQPWLEVYRSYSPIVARLAKVFRRRDLEIRRDHHLVLVRGTDGLTRERLLGPYTDPAETHAFGLEETKRAIAEAEALCRAHGIAFVVVYVPSETRVLAPFVLPRTSAERARYTPPGADRPGPFAVALAEHCRRLGCPMIDLLEALSRRAAVDNDHVFIKHDTHLDRDGHAAAALALVERLRGQGVATARR